MSIFRGKEHLDIQPVKQTSGISKPTEIRIDECLITSAFYHAVVSLSLTATFHCQKVAEKSEHSNQM